jgi:hypothetical protein
VWGLTGAATATMTALIVETVSLYFITSRRLGIRCSILTAFRREPAATIGAAS